MLNLFQVPTSDEYASFHADYIQLACKKNTSPH